MILQNNYKVHFFEKITIADRFLSKGKLYHKIILRFFYFPFCFFLFREFSSLIMLIWRHAGNSYILKFRIGNTQVSDIQGKPYNFNP